MNHEVEFHFARILQHCLEWHSHAAKEAVLFLSDLLALLLLAVLLSVEKRDVDHSVVVDQLLLRELLRANRLERE